MDFRPNITPIEVIKKGAFGGTYFRDICSGVNGKWYRKTWKEFDELKNSIIAQITMMLVLINMVSSVEHH